MRYRYLLTDQMFSLKIQNQVLFRDKIPFKFHFQHLMVLKAFLEFSGLYMCNWQPSRDESLTTKSFNFVFDSGES